MDWKEALSQSFAGHTTQPDAEHVQNVTSTEKVQSEPLHIALERKGRHGKTATIIYGFTCTDSRLKEIAATLKQQIGVGGSARDGEILLQGDWQARARQLLSNLGYNIK